MGENIGIQNFRRQENRKVKLVMRQLGNHVDDFHACMHQRQHHGETYLFRADDHRPLSDGQIMFIYKSLKRSSCKHSLRTMTRHQSGGTWSFPHARRQQNRLCFNGSEPIRRSEIQSDAFPSP